MKEEINFDNIQTLTIDLENDNNLGIIIIIYEDFHLYFDFISKYDEQKSYNWSDNFLDF